MKSKAQKLTDSSIRVFALTLALLSIVSCNSASQEGAEVEEADGQSGPVSTLDQDADGSGLDAGDPATEKAPRTYDPVDGASFKIHEIKALDKAASLVGVERDFFALLPQEAWDSLPKLLEIKFEYLPTRGNTDTLGNTFLLETKDMSVRCEESSFPAIGTIPKYGERELKQGYPQNNSPSELQDGSLDYCGMGCPESTMWFLVPEECGHLTLSYRGEPVAEGNS